MEDARQNLALSLWHRLSAYTGSLSTCGLSAAVPGDTENGAGVLPLGPSFWEPSPVFAKCIASTWDNSKAEANV